MNIGGVTGDGFPPDFSWGRTTTVPGSNLFGRFAAVSAQKLRFKINDVMMPTMKWFFPLAQGQFFIAT